jgi:hypothetical protein
MGFDHIWKGSLLVLKKMKSANLCFGGGERN